MAKGDDRLARLGTMALGALVLALVLSFAWARLGPGPGKPRFTERARVRVQVLNGSGEGGVAGRLASFLRDGGFQVVEVKNADRQDYYATLVVARRADRGPALDVARYLGGPPVIRQASAAVDAEVTVVLGSDRSRLRLGD